MSKNKKRTLVGLSKWQLPCGMAQIEKARLSGL
jgi:hypothetical protein